MNNISDFASRSHQLKNIFLDNPTDFDALLHLRTQLDEQEETTIDEIELGLITELKRSILKQQLDKSKDATDAWNNFKIKRETGGRLKIVADKHMLKRITTVGINDTDIDKLFKVHRSMVSRQIKEHELEFFCKNLMTIMI